MNKLFRIGLAYAALLALAGCMTAGAYMKPDDEQKLERTVTSATQLEQSIGIPSLTVPRADGKTMWVYEGIHKSAGVTSYIPYVNLLMGYNDKNCTRLTVLVDKDSGALSDWHYTSAKDQEYWAKTNDKCEPKSTDATKLAATDVAKPGTGEVAKPALTQAAEPPAISAPGTTAPAR